MNKVASRINDQLLFPVSEKESTELAGIMRVTPISCIVFTLIGLIFQSHIIMFIVAATTLVGAFSKNSLYDRVYNLLAKTKVPPMGIARSIGCGIGAIVLSCSGYFLYIGDNLSAIIAGGLMITVASIAALTQVCFVTLFINLFRKEKVSCCE